MFPGSANIETMFPKQKSGQEAHKCFLFFEKHFLYPGKPLLLPQQCFHEKANEETFVETEEISNVSTTIFLRSPRPNVQNEFISFTNCKAKYTVCYYRTKFSFVKPPHNWSRYSSPNI